MENMGGPKNPGESIHPEGKPGPMQSPIQRREAPRERREQLRWFASSNFGPPEGSEKKVPGNGERKLGIEERREQVDTLNSQVNPRRLLILRALNQEGPSTVSAISRKLTRGEVSLPGQDIKTFTISDICRRSSSGLIETKETNHENQYAVSAELDSDLLREYTKNSMYYISHYPTLAQTDFPLLLRLSQELVGEKGEAIGNRWFELAEIAQKLRVKSESHALANVLDALIQSDSILMTEISPTQPTYRYLLARSESTPRLSKDDPNIIAIKPPDIFFEQKKINIPTELIAYTYLALQTMTDENPYGLYTFDDIVQRAVGAITDETMHEMWNKKLNTVRTDISTLLTYWKEEKQFVERKSYTSIALGPNADPLVTLVNVTNGLINQNEQLVKPSREFEDLLSQFPQIADMVTMSIWMLDENYSKLDTHLSIETARNQLLQQISRYPETGSIPVQELLHMANLYELDPRVWVAFAHLVQSEENLENRLNWEFVSPVTEAPAKEPVRKEGSKRQQIIDLIREKPDLISRYIAEQIGTDPEYVRYVRSHELSQEEKLTPQEAQRRGREVNPFFTGEKRQESINKIIQAIEQGIVSPPKIAEVVGLTPHWVRNLLKETDQQIMTLFNQGIDVSSISDQMKVSRSYIDLLVTKKTEEFFNNLLTSLNEEATKIDAENIDFTKPLTPLQAYRVCNLIFMNPQNLRKYTYKSSKAYTGLPLNVSDAIRTLTTYFQMTAQIDVITQQRGRFSGNQQGILIQKETDNSVALAKAILKKGMAIFTVDEENKAHAGVLQQWLLKILL